MQRFRNALLGWWLVALVVMVACNTSAPYHETFDSAGNWRVGSDAGADGQVHDGIYDLLVKGDDLIIWTTAGEEFSNGIYQVEATPVEGPLNNGYGMLFRVNDEADDFYLFKVSGDGYVWIGRYRNGGEEEAEPLVNEWWFESLAVQQGPNVTNVLRVRAEDGNMIFYVNDQEVGRVTDNAFSRGDIGVMVETLGAGGVRVHFDNFTVTPLEN